MKQEPLVEDIQNYAQDIVDTVRRASSLILDATLVRVRSANRAFYQTFRRLARGDRGPPLHLRAGQRASGRSPTWRTLAGGHRPQELRLSTTS